MHQLWNVAVLGSLVACSGGTKHKAIPTIPKTKMHQFQPVPPAAPRPQTVTWAVPHMMPTTTRVRTVRAYGQDVPLMMNAQI